MLIGTVNVSQSAVYFSIGMPIGVAAPVECERWVPAHWDNGYWVPAQYVVYPCAAPAPGFIGVSGGNGYYGNGYYGDEDDYGWGHHHHHH